MKKQFSVLFLMAIFATAAFGADEKKESKGDGKAHPCKQIAEACDSAGYKKGMAEKHKGLWKNCFEPLMNGKAVEGVSVDSSVIDACKAKRAEHKKKKEAESEKK